ncbi:class 3 adenylate cyclase [Paenibacillus baekrokdamisoli]|uniref:adenylate/guanylate cyclase domain-containing protein n=1 Tax=Paenibacillus baekrokdamisoli TaxID=1712516 RepID=UPI000F7980B4|nr:adenylate/guanylate cyclase domain-containing protein [Paenibacillus baekrokdamisoli]MBB3069323.1 class 3 adenylate cyclase [Paenibacillus baekrokdamisoli]
MKVMFDRFVELCFSVHPQVRKVSRTIYCAGAPAFSPHIHSQRLIRSKETISFKLPEKSIDWRLRVLRSNEHLPLSVVAYPKDSIRNRDQIYEETKEAELIGQGWVTKDIQGQPGQTLRVTNNRDTDVMVVIEREGWEDIVATASQIMLFPEFRSMFSTDVLAPGQQAGISSLTVLFTDLCGSTAYYEEVGDSSAYGYVRQMFDFLMTVVEKHGGSVVKTIGDAVMAVFDSAEDGLEAALFIQRKWHAEKELSLRIGLHHGPAVAVGMNGRNDYFGRTVNMAARIQALGGPGEIVMESGLHQRLAGHKKERDKRPSSIQTSEPFIAELKGLSEPVKLNSYSSRASS